MYEGGGQTIGWVNLNKPPWTVFCDAQNQWIGLVIRAILLLVTDTAVLHYGKYLNSTQDSLNNLIDSIEGLIVPNFEK